MKNFIEVDQIMFTDQSQQETKCVKTALSVFQIASIDAVPATTYARGETVSLRLLDGRNVLVNASYESFMDSLKDTGMVKEINCRENFEPMSAKKKEDRKPNLSVVDN